MGYDGLFKTGIDAKRMIKSNGSALMLTLNNPS